MPGHEATVCLAGKRQGRAECAQTHDALTKRHVAGCFLRRPVSQIEVQDARAAGISRGRLQGAAVVGLLVAWAWGLRRTAR